MASAKGQAIFAASVMGFCFYSFASVGEMPLWLRLAVGGFAAVATGACAWPRRLK